MKTIGIIGGGQLGRMLCLAAQKLGFKVVVLDPTPKSPAALVADKHIVGSFKDKEAILKLANESDYLTFEIEGVNLEALEEIEKSGKPIHPSPRILKIIKDKFAQKTFLINNEIPVAPFALIESEDDALKQGEIFGYPFLLKSRFDAYDGRGNFVVKTKEDVSEAFKKLSGSLYSEKFVPFAKELAVVSARDNTGRVESFEVVETVHKNNICHIVYHPAGVSEDVKLKAREVASKVLESLNGVGVFAVELFLTNENEILVNEIAPRVHNSGHHTIEAYSASQFEQHIRAVTGLPLIKPEPEAPAAVMVNILGERSGQAEYKGGEEAESESGVKVHIYGKMETREERKMGHVTALGNNQEEALKKAVDARNKITI